MELGASTEDFNGIISINYNCISRHFDEWCTNPETILYDFEHLFLMSGISTYNETDVFIGYLLEHMFSVYGAAQTMYSHSQQLWIGVHSVTVLQ